MIVGYDFWGDPDSALFQTKNHVAGAKSMELSGAIFDEMHLSNDAAAKTTTEKKPWGKDTVLLAKFQDNLEAGTIVLDGMEVDRIVIKRRKVGDILWEAVASAPFVAGETNSFTFYDSFVEAYELYEYAVVPMAGPLEGYYTISDEIKADYNGFFISDRAHNYRLFYNYELGDLTSVIPNSTIEPLGGSRYPIVVYSGDLLYQKGSVKCTLMVNPVEEINVTQERRLRQSVMEFLCSKTPKLIRSADGVFLLAAVTGSPKLSAFNRVKGVFNLKFDFVEIGDARSLAELASAGLIEGVT